MAQSSSTPTSSSADSATPKPQCVHRAFDPWGALAKTQRSLAEDIAEDFEELLTSINRKMATRRAFQNSRLASASLRMRYRDFWEVYRVFKDIRSKKFIEIYSKDYKTKEQKKSMTVLVTNKKRLVMILEKFGVDTGGLMEKMVGNCVGEILVSDEKPFEISYNTQAKMVTFKAHYQVINEFGGVV